MSSPRNAAIRRTDVIEVISKALSVARARARRWVEPPVPQRLTGRRSHLDQEARAHLREALVTTYFDGDAAYLARPAGTKDLADHLGARLTRFREHIVPWIDAATRLDGARVLEIGCGTGSSTVALAEQGALVTAIDLDADSIEVARRRCALHGVPAELHVANAVDVPELLTGHVPDIVVFVAALEHMTLDERLSAMAATWAMLRPGGLWCVTDTPNRLWPFDGHTALLPFFHWLPDELAIRYLPMSPRTELAGRWTDAGPDSVAEFVRHGRGISYHEFAVTLCPPDELDVVDSLSSYRERHSRSLRALRALRPARRHERALRRLGPPLHTGFYEDSLDLMVRKP